MERYRSSSSTWAEVAGRHRSINASTVAPESSVVSSDVGGTPHNRCGVHLWGVTAIRSISQRRCCGVAERAAAGIGHRLPLIYPASASASTASSKVTASGRCACLQHDDGGISRRSPHVCAGCDHSPPRRGRSSRGAEYASVSAVLKRSWRGTRSGRSSRAAEDRPQKPPVLRYLALDSPYDYDAVEATLRRPRRCVTHTRAAAGGRIAPRSQLHLQSLRPLRESIRFARGVFLGGPCAATQASISALWRARQLGLVRCAPT